MLNPIQSQDFRTLKSWPAFAVTGIGSLPEMKDSQVLEHLRKLELPYLPSFPTENVQDLLIGQAFGDIPGFFVDLSGKITFSRDLWVKKSTAFREKLEKQDSKDFEDKNFVDSTNLSLLLASIPQNRKSPLKFQWVGPWTIASLLKNVSELSEDFKSEILELSLRAATQRCRSIAAQLKPHASELIFFFDEPCFQPGMLQSKMGQLAWHHSENWRQFLLQEGVQLGIHCCAKTDLNPLLSSPFSLISFDASLILPHFLWESSKTQKWIESGGRLVLGIPENKLHPQEATELSKAFQRSFGAAGRDLLATSLLTPSCGLGLKSLQETKNIFDGLLKLQSHLQSL